jgi:hypothetical protein
MKKLFIVVLLIAFCGLNEVSGQWGINGTHIYNTNTGNVGIGTNSPGKLLDVSKSMTEPTIRVYNSGGSGGATFEMTDLNSGADWKFKATNAGGFKIRDNANALDVFTIESNSFANALYIKNTDNIGIGTAAPASSAIVDLTSADKGFLIPRLTLTQIQSISAPANGLQVFCTTNDKMYIYILSEDQWKEIAYGAGTISPPFLTCGDNLTISHVAGAVAPVNKLTSYGTVTNIPGETTKCWITKNLGADRQATAVNDATEESAGWYWQFNRQQGYKHDGVNRTPNTAWISSISENSDWLAANDPCTIELGAGWRLPTSTEWTNVDASGGWTNWNGPWNSALKMHAAGYLYSSNGSLGSRGLYGYYWSSTQHDSSYGWYLYFYSGNCNMDDSYKAYGFTARCLRD